ncbi:MAG TPA: RnfABCDGE type electron transport complex subunit B [Clostridiaceae bacterium]|nr:RnfABCDGE type electron transport complex subunit B [Clostridiaceae bacterium]
MLEGILLPVLIVGGLGLIFGLGLAYASKKFEVKQDERIVQIREVLPGANCGACGFTGCDNYAESLVNEGAAVNACTVGGQSVANKIAEILGVEAKSVDPVIARVMCSGSNDVARRKFIYGGIQDCSAAANLYGGPMACTYGCVGMGNCVRACAFNAIVIENGVARVIPSKCTACGNCVAACPKKIIELVSSCCEYTVSCSSRDRGNIAKKNCDVGCIGCGRCMKACQYGAITVNDFLAKIDSKICTNCGECIKVCPTGSIKLYFCKDLHEVSNAG